MDFRQKGFRVSRLLVKIPFRKKIIREKVQISIQSSCMVFRQTKHGSQAIEKYHGCFV